MFFLLCPSVLSAQGFYEQPPPGVQWRKIDTLNFEVVFPEEITHEGQRVANTLEHLHGPLGKTMPRNSRRISVFLMNRLTTANGYVGFMPRHSTFFSTPPQGPFAGLTDWYTLLAVHEGRHIVQFDKLNRGFTRIGGILYGDAGGIAFSALATPTWLWEGDAVAAETTLTRGGRGRQPSFDLDLRAQILEGKRFSYYKNYFGSYKDRTTDIYSLGYPLVTRMRRERGALAWSRVADRASRWSFWPFAFHGALKKEYGKGPVGLYEDTTTEMKALWQKQLEGLRFTTYRKINPETNRSFTAYLFPEYDEDGSVVAQRLGRDEPSALVRISPDGHEERLTRFAPQEPFATRGSVAGGKIVWNETAPDLRWSGRNVSEIVVFDVSKRRSRRLTRGTKLLNPAISPDGARVAAVEFTPERACALVVIDATTGGELQRLPNPENDVLAAPSWSEDGARLVFTRQGRRGRALCVANSATGRIRDVIPPGWEDVTYPSIHGRHVFYNSPYSGIDNIYALNLDSGIRYQVTSSRLGAFFAHVSQDGKKLLYSEYAFRGHDVAETELNPDAWMPLDEVEDRNVRYFEPLVAQEQGGPITDENMIPTAEYPVKKYRPLARLLNVHSWIIMPGAPQGGLALLSDDKLNTLSLLTSVLYDAGEKVASVGMTGTYRGFFPLLDLGMSHGGRAEKLENADVERNVDAAARNGAAKTFSQSWRETEIWGGLRIPLNLSRGVNNTTLSLNAQVGFTRISDKEMVDFGDNGNGDFARAGYSARFTRIRHGAYRDVRPTWGQVLQASYQHTPLSGDYNGSLLHGSARAFLPGMFRHHAIMARGGYEEQQPKNYIFDSSLAFTRGYDSVAHKRLVMASAEYSFPIADPDLSLGPLLYVKRIKGNLFYDYGRGFGGQTTWLYRSAGAEIVFESHLFSLPMAVDLGARYVYRYDHEHVEGGRHRIEPFIGLGF